MLCGRGGVVVDGEGDEFDFASPIPAGFSDLLEFGHWFLAGAAPGGPPFQNDDFSAEVGELRFVGAREAEQLDFWSGRGGWKAAMFGDVVLKFLPGDFFFREKAFGEADPPKFLQMPLAAHAV